MSISLSISKYLLNEFEPFTNVFYQILISNIDNSTLSNLEIIVFIFFITPNSLLILNYHSNSRHSSNKNQSSHYRMSDEVIRPNIFIQSFCVLNLAPFFFTSNFDFVLLGN